MPVLPILTAIAILVALRLQRLPSDVIDRAERSLLSNRAPVLVAVVSALFFWWYWGSLSAIPGIHDEHAYLLQSRIFASLRWSTPSPPLPEFFEQYHVLVVPTLSPKYPPGHAILMVPGVWVGAPGLTPVVLSAMTAVMVFVLSRRLAGAWIAILTLALWHAAPLNLWFRPSYFSGLTTAFLWLVGWWALLRYRSAPHAGWMALVGVVVGWGGLTRPLTMMAFALPTAVVALMLIVRRQRWGDTLPALAATLIVCSIIPLWSRGVLGETSPTPYAYYSKLYFPSDELGFGVDSTPPSRVLPPDMAWHYENRILPVRAAHTPHRLPAILIERLARIARDSWGPHVYLAIPATFALLVLTAELAVATATFGSLVLSYLLFAHPSDWTLYYLEAQPVLALLSAVGLLRLNSMARTFRRRNAHPAAPFASRVHLLPTAVAVLVITGLPKSVFANRAMRAEKTEYHRTFAALLARIPDERAIVFVRYDLKHDPHYSLVMNDPDPASTRVWRVYDRGPDNLRLVRMARERAVYVFDETKPPSDPRRLDRIADPESYFLERAPRDSINSAFASERLRPRGTE